MKTADGIVGWVVFTSCVVVVAREGQPPAVADFSFSATSANPSNQFATAAMDLPIGNEGQDSQAEVEGAIINGFVAGKRPIQDIKVWMEDRNGNLLRGVGGGCPVTELRSSATTEGSVVAATLAGRSDGVATFRLANPIASGATGGYDLQIGALQSPVPNQFILKMQASYETEHPSEQFEVLGGKSFRSDDREQFFDVFQDAIRTGSVMELTNVDPRREISALRVTLVTEHQGIDLIGVRVEDSAGKVVSGTSVEFAPDGSYFDLPGLNVRNGEGLLLWIELSAPYERDAGFRVRATY